MNTIPATYDELCKKTKTQCPSITFWRTLSGNWAARAGLGEVVIYEDDLERTIGLAVASGVKEFRRRKKEEAGLRNRVDAVKKRRAVG